MEKVDLRPLRGIVTATPRDKSAEPSAELGDIERDMLGRFTFAAKDETGRTIQLTPGMLRVLAKHPDQADWLLSSTDMRGLLRKQAAEDVSAAVDRATSGALIYPACAWDKDTVLEALGIFPAITDVYLIDHGYRANYRIGGVHQFRDFTNAVGFKGKGAEVHGEFGKGGEIAAAGEKDGRRVRFHFRSEEFFGGEAGLPGGKAAVYVVKYAGEGGGLADDPRFYPTVLDITKDGGYVLVKHSRKPPHEMKGLRPVLETDMSHPGSTLFVSGDDWAVYRKNAQT